MKERIQQLIEQCTIDIECFDAEKFAKLIVRECIREIGFKSAELLDIDFYPHYQERLKKYFEFKE